MKSPCIKIFYEDNHVIVVEKPVNIPSQADSSKDIDMLSLIKQDIKHRYGKPGNVYIGLVQRLDRPVGGVMVFAKTSKSASRLSDQIRTRQLKKGYLAVVNGVPPLSNGMLKHYVIKDTRINKVSIVSENTPNAKEAVLYYTVLKSAQSLSLVHINLETGRPHQIRAQFAEIGNPLYADQKYCRNQEICEGQIALWSFEILFEHPTKKGQMYFRSLPPFEQYPWNIFKDIDQNGVLKCIY